MPEHESFSSKPYFRYAGTAVWIVIDRALQELTRQSLIQERTEHPYLVGYLCEALVQEGLAESTPRPSREEKLAIIEAAQEEFRSANPHRRNPMQELIVERRNAASSGE